MLNYMHIKSCNQEVKSESVEEKLCTNKCIVLKAYLLCR